MGPNKHPPYLEFSDDPRVLNNLDELVVTYVYLQIRQEKQRKRRRNNAAMNRGGAGLNNMAMQGGMAGGMAGGPGMGGAAF